MIAGSQLKTGGNTGLDTTNDILLSGAVNTQKATGKNSNSGGGVGVSIGAGGNGAGISVPAGVNMTKGSEKGNGTEWTEATIDSGKTVTINSGRGMVLNGAQVNGNRIIADVDRDLPISSQQDTSKYDSKQANAIAGGSFILGSMTGSGYTITSRDKMKSRFDFTAEQIGMFAGDDGFDITMSRYTQLDGTVIASTATPGKNHLDTGMLGFSDLHNEADHKVSYSGISLSGGGSSGDKFQGNMPDGMISAGGHSGHTKGTTQVAVAEGIITIRDRDNQKQNLTSLSRDPVHTDDNISPIFDKRKEQRRLQTVGLIGDIGNQVTDIARTQGELNTLRTTKEATDETLSTNATEKQCQGCLAKLCGVQTHRNEMAKYGIGSEIQRGIQVVTAAFRGLVGGGSIDALAGASAPESAHLLRSAEKDPAVSAVARAILGGVAAAMQGNNVAASIAGVAAGGLAARAVTGVLHPGVKQLDLSEEREQTMSMPTTMSAGLACGLARNSTVSATIGVQSRKNAVKSNSLSDGWNNVLSSGTQDYGQAAASWNQYAQSNNLTPEQVQEGMNRIAIGKEPSWGVTYRVHPVVQAGGDVSLIRGYILSGIIDDDHILVSRGDIYGIGTHGGISIGLSFGPYLPGLMNSNDSDYSMNGSFGVDVTGLSTDKDGASFASGFGPSWGWSITEIRGIDANGTSTSGVYRYDLK